MSNIALVPNPNQEQEIPVTTQNLTLDELLRVHINQLQNLMQRKTNQAVQLLDSLSEEIMQTRMALLSKCANCHHEAEHLLKSLRDVSDFADNSKIFHDIAKDSLKDVREKFGVEVPGDVPLTSG